MRIFRCADCFQELDITGLNLLPGQVLKDWFCDICENYCEVI